MTTVDDDRHDARVAHAVRLERTRLANLLHDGALQDLMIAHQDLAEALDGGHATRETLRAHLDRVTGSLRGLTGTLHEESLGELSLAEALARVVLPVTQRGRLDVSLVSDPAADGYNDPVVRDAARQLLANVEEHAGARTAAVTVAIEDGELQLRVSDDGSGFDLERSQLARGAGHLGLSRLERVASRLGGSFSITTADPRGTVATLRLPTAALDGERTGPGGSDPATILGLAERRDAAALSRDRVALERDQLADTRDEASGRVEAFDAQEDLGLVPTAVIGILRARTRRARTGEGRTAGHQDREDSARDRQQAAAGRLQAGVDRAALADQLRVAETDALTGARARGPGLADLERELDRCRRTGGVLTVAYVDVVGLKLRNDTAGHAAGDALLATIVETIKTRLRPYDLVVRIGGDEFLCALSNVSLVEAQQRFTAIASDLAASPALAAIDSGIAQYDLGESADELMARADADLFRRRGTDGRRHRDAPG